MIWLILSPTLGLVYAFGIALLAMYFFSETARLSHSANDGQKTIG
ncbi:MAG TPA: hypothetical protein VFX75_05700 [Nitrososphaeraceae archaeon]|nr:hypothetical protein [Nitrososphaeraceae archaeon]